MNLSSSSVNKDNCTDEPQNFQLPSSRSSMPWYKPSSHNGTDGEKKTLKASPGLTMRQGTGGEVESRSTNNNKLVSPLLIQEYTPRVLQAWICDPSQFMMASASSHHGGTAASSCHVQHSQQQCQGGSSSSASGGASYFSLQAIVAFIDITGYTEFAHRSMQWFNQPPPCNENGGIPTPDGVIFVPATSGASKSPSSTAAFLNGPAASKATEFISFHLNEYFTAILIIAQEEFHADVISFSGDAVLMAWYYDLPPPSRSASPPPDQPTSSAEIKVLGENEGNIGTTVDGAQKQKDPYRSVNAATIAALQCLKKLQKNCRAYQVKTPTATGMNCNHEEDEDEFGLVDKKKEIFCTLSFHGGVSCGKVLCVESQAAQQRKFVMLGPTIEAACRCSAVATAGKVVVSQAFKARCAKVVHLLRQYAADFSSKFKSNGGGNKTLTASGVACSTFLSSISQLQVQFSSAVSKLSGSYYQLDHCENLFNLGHKSAKNVLRRASLRASTSVTSQNYAEVLQFFSAFSYVFPFENYLLKSTCTTTISPSASLRGEKSEKSSSNMFHMQDIRMQLSNFFPSQLHANPSAQHPYQQRSSSSAPASQQKVYGELRMVCSLFIKVSDPLLDHSQDVPSASCSSSFGSLQDQEDDGLPPPLSHQKGTGSRAESSLNNSFNNLSSVSTTSVNPRGISFQDIIQLEDSQLALSCSSSGYSSSSDGDFENNINNDNNNGSSAPCYPKANPTKNSSTSSTIGGGKGRTNPSTATPVTVPNSVEYRLAQRIQKIHQWVHYYAETKYDGTLNKILYDDKGLVCLCLFGLPRQTHPNGIDRTVQCAVAIGRKLTKYFAAVSLGISRARVYCGVVGSTKTASSLKEGAQISGRREYTALGDGVNISARLMSLSEDQLAKEQEFRNIQQQTATTTSSANFKITVDEATMRGTNTSEIAFTPPQLTPVKNRGQVKTYVVLIPGETNTYRDLTPSPQPGCTTDAGSKVTPPFAQESHTPVSPTHSLSGSYNPLPYSDMSTPTTSSLSATPLASFKAAASDSDVETPNSERSNSLVWLGSSPQQTGTPGLRENPHLAVLETHSTEGKGEQHFVGREKELEAVKQFLSEARMKYQFSPEKEKEKEADRSELEVDPFPFMLWVVAPAFYGKTSLLSRAFVQFCQTEGRSPEGQKAEGMVRVQCKSEDDLHRPYHLIKRVLNAVLQLESRDWLHAALQRIFRKRKQRQSVHLNNGKKGNDELEQDSTMFFHLLSLIFEDSTLLPFSHRQQDQHTDKKDDSRSSAVYTVVSRQLSRSLALLLLSSKQLALISIDDAQWMDSLSWDVCWWATIGLPQEAEEGEEKEAEEDFKFSSRLVVPMLFCMEKTAFYDVGSDAFQGSKSGKSLLKLRCTPPPAIPHKKEEGTEQFPEVTLVVSESTFEQDSTEEEKKIHEGGSSVDDPWLPEANNQAWELLSEESFLEEEEEDHQPLPSSPSTNDNIGEGGKVYHSFDFDQGEPIPEKNSSLRQEISKRKNTLVPPPLTKLKRSDRQLVIFLQRQERVYVHGVSQFQEFLQQNDNKFCHKKKKQHEEIFNATKSRRCSSFEKKKSKNPNNDGDLNILPPPPLPPMSNYMSYFLPPQVSTDPQPTTTSNFPENGNAKKKGSAGKGSSTQREGVLFLDSFGFREVRDLSLRLVPQAQEVEESLVKKLLAVSNGVPGLLLDIFHQLQLHHYLHLVPEGPFWSIHVIGGGGQTSKSNTMEGRKTVTGGTPLIAASSSKHSQQSTAVSTGGGIDWSYICSQCPLLESTVTSMLDQLPWTHQTFLTVCSMFQGESFMKIHVIRAVTLVLSGNNNNNQMMHPSPKETEPDENSPKHRRSLTTTVATQNSSLLGVVVAMSSEEESIMGERKKEPSAGGGHHNTTTQQRRKHLELEQFVRSILHTLVNKDGLLAEENSNGTAGPQTPQAYGAAATTNPVMLRFQAGSALCMRELLQQRCLSHEKQTYHAKIAEAMVSTLPPSTTTSSPKNGSDIISLSNTNATNPNCIAPQVYSPLFSPIRSNSSCFSSFSTNGVVLPNNNGLSVNASSSALEPEVLSARYKDIVFHYHHADESRNEISLSWLLQAAVRLSVNGLLNMPEEQEGIAGTPRDTPRGPAPVGSNSNTPKVSSLSPLTPRGGKSEVRTIKRSKRQKATKVASLNVLMECLRASLETLGGEAFLMRQVAGVLKQTSTSFLAQLRRNSNCQNEKSDNNEDDCDAKDGETRGRRYCDMDENDDGNTGGDIDAQGAFRTAAEHAGHLVQILIIRAKCHFQLEQWRQAYKLIQVTLRFVEEVFRLRSGVREYIHHHHKHINEHEKEAGKREEGTMRRGNGKEMSVDEEEEEREVNGCCSWIFSALFGASGTSKRKQEDGAAKRISASSAASHCYSITEEKKTKGALPSAADGIYEKQCFLLDQRLSPSSTLFSKNNPKNDDAILLSLFHQLDELHQQCLMFEKNKSFSGYAVGKSNKNLQMEEGGLHLRRQQERERKGGETPPSLLLLPTSSGGMMENLDGEYYMNSISDVETSSSCSSSGASFLDEQQQQQHCFSESSTSTSSIHFDHRHEEITANNSQPPPQEGSKTPDQIIIPFQSETEPPVLLSMG